MDQGIEPSSKESVHGFVTVKNLNQVKELQGKLVQFHYPVRDDYFIGYISRVKERIRGRDDKAFIRIYLKDSTKRSGMPYDMRLYNRLKESGKLDAGTILQYHLNRDVTYKTM